MTMPYPNITQIPNNEPDAVPALWNTRYVEIDANFSSLDGRVTGNSSELAAARNGAASLDARLDAMDGNISATSVEMQNMDAAALKFALTQAALANDGVKTLRQVIQQEGEFTLINRGLVSGGAISAYGASRLLSITGGKCFINGRIYGIAAQQSLSVPEGGVASDVCYGYLSLDAAENIIFRVTTFGAAVPSDGIKVCTITVPAVNTSAALVGVTITSTARVEANYPNVLDSPAQTSPVLKMMEANDYRLDFDVVSASGAPCDAKEIVVTGRQTNGFAVALASAADNVVVRWRASRLSLPNQSPVVDFVTGFHAAAPVTY